MRNHPGLFEKTLQTIAMKPHAQHFDRGLRFEMDMFSQIHVCEAALAKQTHQLIVPKLFANKISHALLLQENSEKAEGTPLCHEPGVLLCSCKTPRHVL